MQQAIRSERLLRHETADARSVPRAALPFADLFIVPYNPEAALSLSPWISFPLEAVWTPIFSFGKHFRWTEGVEIFHAGDPMPGAYFIRRGIAKLATTNSEGKLRTLCLYAGQSIVGIHAVLNSAPNLHTLTALTPCDTYVYDRRTLEEVLIPHYPEVSLAVIRCLAAVNVHMSAQLETIAFLPARARTALFLHQMHEASARAADPYNDPLRLSHQSIADVLGLHRTTVSQAIADLRREGIVTGTRRLRVLSPERLLEAVFAAERSARDA